MMMENLNEMPEATNRTASGTIEHKRKPANGFVRLWKYLSVEPMVLCYLLPYMLQYTALQNLELEKACRANLKYPDAVCDSMINKSIHNIDCSDFSRKMQEKNVIHLLSDRSQVFNDTLFINGTRILPEYNPENITALFDIHPLEPDVCEAEVKSQKLKTHVNEYTLSLQSIFPIVVILFAASWSDKRGQRKICMLMPLMGELACSVVLLIAVIFFKQLPVQFSSFLSVLLPAMTGGATAMWMGVYSYMSETTSVENRSIRFSVMVQFVSVAYSVFFPLSVHLMEWLGYVKLFMICVPANILGIYLIIFVMEEPDCVKPLVVENGIDNPAFESTPQIHDALNRLAPETNEKKKPNIFLDFFDPTVPIQISRIIVRKRENRGRAILNVLFFLYFFSLGPGYGEEQHENNFTKLQLNWGVVSYVYYSTYLNGLDLISTTILIFVFKKWLKLADVSIGVISTGLGCVARILFCYTTTSLMFYIARTVDIFISLRIIVLSSIISILVDKNEVARAFSIIAIIEECTQSVFAYGYGEIYERTLKTWPAAFFFASLLFSIICVLCFASLYFILRGNTRFEGAAAHQMELENVQKKDQTATCEPSQA